MRAFGADVRLTGTSSDDARDAARAFSAATGALLVEDACSTNDQAGEMTKERAFSTDSLNG
jgi:threonine dehydratase